jgi:hypothetical protein
MDLNVIKSWVLDRMELVSVYFFESLFYCFILLSLNYVRDGCWRHGMCVCVVKAMKGVVRMNHFVKRDCETCGFGGWLIGWQNQSDSSSAYK